MKHSGFIIGIFINSNFTAPFYVTDIEKGRLVLVSNEMGATVFLNNGKPYLPTFDLIKRHYPNSRVFLNPA